VSTRVLYQYVESDAAASRPDLANKKAKGCTTNTPRPALALDKELPKMDCIRAASEKRISDDGRFIFKEHGLALCLQP
jgi:hypothetical protein